MKTKITEKALQLLAALNEQAENYGEYRMVQLSEEDVALLRQAIIDGSLPAEQASWGSLGDPVTLDKLQEVLTSIYGGPQPPMGKLEARDAAGYGTDQAWFRRYQAQKEGSQGAEKGQNE